ncbi:hypothetical protein [Nonomuraea sp. LPB2021202275-12-8]|uniref:hypothetical protein n=1 Tax=Nonomuraea sp. LPB2021202275-12-8 TaxID=3120159 RepID=UPI00300D810D
MITLPAHYLQAVEDLAADAIVKKMAARMPDHAIEKFVDADGNLRYDFMRAAAEEYLQSGGQHRGPIGAVGHAMLRLRGNPAPAEASTSSPVPGEAPAPTAEDPAELPQESTNPTQNLVSTVVAVDDLPSCIHGPDCQHQRCERYGCGESDCCR